MNFNLKVMQDTIDSDCLHTLIFKKSNGDDKATLILKTYSNEFQIGKIFTFEILGDLNVKPQRSGLEKWFKKIWNYVINNPDSWNVDKYLQKRKADIRAGIRTR